MQVLWPFLVKHRDPRPWLAGQSLEPVRSISGAFTILPVASAHWMMDLAVLIEDEAALLQFQAFLVGMEGRNGTTLAPVYSWTRARDRDGRTVAQNLTGHLDGGGTSEHWGFEAGAAVTCTVAEDAALRSTRLRFTLGNTSDLRPGHFFSIGDHLYQAQAVWFEEGARVVQFQPPLRKAAVTGDVMVLDRVQCRMRLRDERVNLDFRKPFVQTVQLNFIEAL